MCVCADDTGLRSAVGVRVEDGCVLLVCLVDSGFGMFRYFTVSGDLGSGDGPVDVSELSVGRLQFVGLINYVPDGLLSFGLFLSAGNGPCKDLG